ncbi:hypothetical protein LA080_013975 [Diaporthe eres]|nr:hypothetical protein LA080_013975 [Diaporthe eres]
MGAEERSTQNHGEIQMVNKEARDTRSIWAYISDKKREEERRISKKHSREPRDQSFRWARSKRVGGSSGAQTTCCIRLHVQRVSTRHTAVGIARSGWFLTFGLDTPAKAFLDRV